MSILKYLVAYTRLFQRPTLAELIVQDLKVFTQTKADCEKVIKCHEYEKHMAEASIHALKAWVNKY